MTRINKAALAALLLERRTEHGLSRPETAKRAGIDRGTLWLLERGKIAEPQIATVRAVAEVLMIPLADVYAAADWLPENAMPSLRPYMRAKYSTLTDAEIGRIERFVEQVSSAHQKGPEPGQDE